MVLEMDTCPSVAATEYSFFTYDFARPSWDDVAKTMSYPTGVVPMPDDYLSSLKFDFVTTADGGTTWTFLKAGADTIQVLEFWMTPLDAAQMEALGMVAPAP